MISLLAVFQFAVAVPTHLSPKDPAKLVARVREAEFQYIMDWRHEWESWRVSLAFDRQSQQKAISRLPEPPLISLPTDMCDQWPITSTRAGQHDCMRTAEGCDLPVGTIRYDIDEHECAAHVIPAPAYRPSDRMPLWVLPIDTEPADDALGIDNALPSKWRDTVRARRVPLLALVDSAARILVGDRWLAGQRVRLHVDQKEYAQAMQATTECRAAPWWCLALRGYVRFTARDEAASATFDSAQETMPPDTLCRWNDVGALLPYTARTAYEDMPCVQQASVNARIWWLGDPLFLEPGNVRKTQHFARQVLVVLHAGNDADEYSDMRDRYAGFTVREMVLRYGWPTTMAFTPPAKCVGGAAKLGIPPVCEHHTPPGWSRFDTHDVNLRLNPPPRYWGPEYHTIPTWSAISDPLHAQTTDWDIGPQRQDTLIWDSSWWAREFYRRYQGPLVDLSTQIAFVRRHASAAIVAAMEWVIDPAILAPPAHAAVGVITSGGPYEKPHIVGAKMDGAHPRAILTPVESRPLLLGVEMVPENDSGAAGRTRFGIAPPPPLSALKRGDLTLSDLMLVRATPADSFPTSIQDVLPRMYGSTTLLNPTRLAVFWEVYGQGDGDTVDVSLRIVRRNDAGALARAAAVVGIGHAGDDTTTVRWREPRPGDPLAFAENGVSIRPRGFALDVSSLTAGTYTLSVRVDRRDVSATSAPREFTIVRR